MISEKLKGLICPDYDNWVRIKMWSVGEATLLLLDIEPKVDFKNKKIKALSQSVPMEVIEEFEIKTSKMKAWLLAGPFCTQTLRKPPRNVFESMDRANEPDHTVSYEKILIWAFQNKIEIPKNLIETAKKIHGFSLKDSKTDNYSTKKTDQIHGKTKKMYEDNLDIIGTALTVLKNKRDECLDKKKAISGKGIYNALKKFEKTLWTEGESPLKSEQEVTRLINSYLNKLPS